MITTILFDIGDTLVRAADPGTPVATLEAEPLEGVVRTVRALAGRLRLGAVTDTATMSEAEVRALLRPTGLDELLEVVVTSTGVGATKPDPCGVLAALEQLGAAPHEALFVGDADVDAGAAGAAGVSFARAGGGATLAEVVRAALTELDDPLTAALALVGPTDAEAERSALRHQDQLTKPTGALGRIESLGIQLCAIAGEDPPPIPSPAAVAVFAGDHGVLAEGVTPWPQEVTAQMVANFVAGGAAINVLARQAGATVTVVDVGLASSLDALGLDGAPGLLRRSVRPGTENLATRSAMTQEEARRALDIGADVAHRLVSDGARALVTGDMGIGNTTPSAALISALTCRTPREVTGRGTGIDEATFERKVAAIEQGLARVPAGADPVQLLAEVGGLEIAALAGFIVGGASHQVPVVVDGVIAGAALLVAHELCPEVVPYVVAGHRSTEPGCEVALDRLGLEPVLDLGLRLGEGTGACLALGLLESAARVLREMATFDDAAVKDAR